MLLTKIEDHLAQGLALLISQYRGKPRIAALASSYLRRVQELEDACIDTLIKRLLDNAIGEQLKAIGRIVGQANEESWDDTTYRLFIKARIRANQSDGHADDVIDVLRLVEAAPFTLREYFPATMFVDYTAAPAVAATILIKLIRRAKASGVRLQLIYGSHTVAGDGFSFVAGTADTISTTQGSGLSDESTGGYLSGALE